MSTVLIIGLLLFAGFCVHQIVTGGPTVSDEEMATYRHGPKNPALVCPHCQEQGAVRTKAVRNKKGISGAKATGAILTGGVSILATGLSRKEAQTAAHCDNCGSGWHF